MGSKSKKNARRLPCDPTKVNMGNSYSPPPHYYYDIEFECIDCGKAQTWTKEQQKWWYEEVGGYYFATANRCRECRHAERDRIKQARINAGHEPNA